MRWVDPETGEPVTLGRAFDVPVSGRLFLYRTIDTALRRIQTSPQPDAIAPDGNLCTRNTVGLLTPAPTIATGIDLIGKESRRWRDGRGVITQPEYVHYGQADNLPAGLAKLRAAYPDRGGARQIAEETGIPERTVRAILREGRTPSSDSAERLRQLAQ